MAVPTYGSAGSNVAGTAAVSPAYPATVNADDIAILLFHSCNQPIATPSGWTSIASPGVGTAAAVDSLALQAFWRRCDGTEDATTLSLPDSGDHNLATIFTIAGCKTSGDPTHQSNTWTDGTATTAFTVPGFTTTQSDVLVVAVFGRGNDNSSTSSFSSPANSDLGSVTERFEGGTGTGWGGGYVVITGTKATAGTVGATTTTGPSAKQANLVFGLLSTTSTGGVTATPRVTSFWF